MFRLLFFTLPCICRSIFQKPWWASPGFPVELGGVGELHAAFLTESRTREPVWSLVQEIRVARQIRPTYAPRLAGAGEANVGHPSSSYWVLLGAKVYLLKHTRS
jgi:hypothetical protein